MSLEEKEYIFGHRISGKDGAKKRIEYSRNMDRLWRIAQKLDKAPFCKKLYELHFPQLIVGDGIVAQEGRGQGMIRIPWESAVYGQKLHLHFEGSPNASVSISTPNAVRPFGGLPVEVKMADAPVPLSSYPQRITLIVPSAVTPLPMGAGAFGVSKPLCPL